MRARDLSRRAIIAMGVAAFSCGGDATNGRLFSNKHVDGGAGEPAGSGGKRDTNPPDMGCVKDTDCKGDRVCEDGMCVAPSGGAGGASSGGGRADGGTEAGGSDASGGRRATGGMTMGGTSAGGADSGGSANGGASTGGVSAGGVGAGGKPVMCSVGQKPCQGKCVYPTPAVGCDLDSCAACTAAVPAHAYAVCINSQCGWECTAGYTRTPAGCVASGAGGYGGYGGFFGIGGYNSGGRVGTGGAKESCNAPSVCHNTCAATNPLPCCTSAGKCGCSIISLPGYCN